MCVYQELFPEGTVVSCPQLSEGVLNQMISSQTQHEDWCWGRVSKMLPEVLVA